MNTILHILSITALIIFVAIALIHIIATIILGWMFKHAPEGYEDEGGWHPVKP